MNFELRSVTIARQSPNEWSSSPRRTTKSPNHLHAGGALLDSQTHSAAQAEERALSRCAPIKTKTWSSLGQTAHQWTRGTSAERCSTALSAAAVTPITLHGLRDTHASLCAKAGVPIEVVSQRLGHASIGVTVERYLHVYSKPRRRGGRCLWSPGRLVKEKGLR